MHKSHCLALEVIKNYILIFFRIEGMLCGEQELGKNTHNSIKAGDSKATKP